MPDEIRVEKSGRSYAAKCRRCDYEFIAGTERGVREVVVKHEAECSDSDGEWARYDIGDSGGSD